MKDSLQTMGKKTVIILIIVLVTVVSGVFYFFYSVKENAESSQVKETKNDKRLPIEEEIMATGTTVVGMYTEEIDFSYLETELVVEDVHLSNGNQVEAHTPILNITMESLEAAKWELERNETEAELAYRQGVIDYQIGKVEAQAIYDTTVKETEFAQTDYEIRFQKMNEESSDLEDKVEEALELYTEYTNSIEKNTYYEEFEVVKKKENYEAHKLLYEEYLKRWNIEDQEVNTTSNSNKGMGNLSGGDRQERLMALGLLEDEYREDFENYELAVKEYEKAVETAKASIASAKASYELLQIEYKQHKIDAEKKAASDLATYQLAVLKSKTAQDTYETEEKKLQEEVKVLKNKKEEAIENRIEFQGILGDGYLYTESKGEVVMMAVRENSLLNDAKMVLAYNNPDTVKVSTSVDQSSIAQLCIGDEAMVIIDGIENYGGKITEINPVSNSTSKASVTYLVEITLQGDVSAVSANQTATVFFDVNVEEGGHNEIKQKKE